MDNDVSQVIDRTDLIENLLNQVIHNYSSPRKEASEFFWNILLDSSIMPLGSKIKVAMAISQKLGATLKPDSLHKVVAYRNAFAHHRISSHPTVVVGKTPEEDELHYMLQIIKQSGKIDRKRRVEALEEFNKHYEMAKKSLLDLLETVKNELNNCRVCTHNKAMVRNFKSSGFASTFKIRTLRRWATLGHVGPHCYERKGTGPRNDV